MSSLAGTGLRTADAARVALAARSQPPIKDSTDRLRIKLREALKLLKPEELQAKDAPGSDRKGKKPRLA